MKAIEKLIGKRVIIRADRAGRKAFCEDRGLDYEHGHYTVNEFISLTREAYGSEAIQELERTLP